MRISGAKPLLALFGERALDRDRALDRVGRRLEHREEPVAAAALLDLGAVVPRQEIPDRPVVRTQHRRPLLVAHLRDELGRVDDVGEHERAANLAADRRVAEPIAQSLRGLDVARRAEVAEHGERGVELDDRDLAVAGAHRRLGEELLRLRGFVRRARRRARG